MRLKDVTFFRSLMTAQGLSCADLAAKVTMPDGGQISRRYVEMLRAGQRGASPLVAEKIAAALHVLPESLWTTEPRETGSAEERQNVKA